MYLLPSQKNITKSNSFYEAVISGDSLILRRPANVQGQPPKERCVACVNITSLLLRRKNSSVLHLADLTAPRLGTSTREDEVRPLSFNGSTQKSRVNFNGSLGLSNLASFFVHSQLARKSLLRRFIPYLPTMISLVISAMLKLRE